MLPVVLGLGCMRLSTDLDRDETRARATIHAALSAGVTLLDTARAYGHSDEEAGHNERWVAAALKSSGIPRAALRVVTKCGMRRPAGGWRADGRATAILSDAGASAETFAAAGGVDALLLHAPDPATDLSTSLRALRKALDGGLTRAVGLSNVGVRELEAALQLIPSLAIVEVALGAFDDASALGGVVRFCGDRGIDVLAHSPLGGPEKSRRLGRDKVLLELGTALGVTPAQLVLAYLQRVHPRIIPIPGARRPETAASLEGVAPLAASLDETALKRLDARFPGLGWVRAPPRAPRAGKADREVVLLVGLAGAGKSRAAEAWVERGYQRLNRDTLGGTLKAIARRLDERLGAGASKLVLDNTYLGRASRAQILLAAHRHGVAVRCVFLDTPPAEAQVNVVLRMLEGCGKLLEPHELAAAAKKSAGLFMPGPHFRMVRDLEPPGADEGFSIIETIRFERILPAGSRRGRLLRLEELAGASFEPEEPTLVTAWRPGATAAWEAETRDRIAARSGSGGATVELAICRHPAGPPACWCRPPLPGLWVEFARRHRLDPRPPHAAR